MAEGGAGPAPASPAFMPNLGLPFVPRGARACAVAAFVALGLAGHGMPAPAAEGPREVTFAGRAMGTTTQVTLVTADSTAAAPAAAAAQRALARVDSLMSNWTTTSEVARLNRDAHEGPTPVQPEVARVLARALEVGRASGGAFDVTVEPLVRAWGFLGGRPHLPDSTVVREAFTHVGPGHLAFDPAAGTLRLLDPGARVDLGGIAKGFAVDAAIESLVAAGIPRGLVNVSGNMRALGAPPDADAWRIGVRDPRDRVPYFARLAFDRGGLSTSGKYEQFVAADGRTYGHIMDPRTGRPAEGLIAVTVIAPTAMDADAWSTALFVLGPEEAMRAATEHPEIMAILVAPADDGTDVVWVERDLRPRFVMEPGAERWFHVRYF